MQSTINHANTSSHDDLAWRQYPGNIKTKFPVLMGGSTMIDICKDDEVDNSCSHQRSLALLAKEGRATFFNPLLRPKLLPPFAMPGPGDGADLDGQDKEEIMWIEQMVLTIPTRGQHHQRREQRRPHRQPHEESDEVDFEEPLKGHAHSPLDEVRGRASLVATAMTGGSRLFRRELLLDNMQNLTRTLAVSEEEEDDDDDDSTCLSEGDIDEDCDDLKDDFELAHQILGTRSSWKQ